jgi:tryptophan synthase beta chain
MKQKDLYSSKGVPKYWFNIVPYIENTLNEKVPELLDPESGDPMDWEKLAQTLPVELAKQEMNIGEYEAENYIKIPDRVLELYERHRPTPLVRAEGLEKDLGLDKVKIYFKREDTNKIGSYKLNSAFVQAYYAKEEGVELFIGDTDLVTGGWGWLLRVRNLICLRKFIWRKKIMI